MTDAERLRELARKGGQTTAARAKNDPTYYARIGKLGGKAGNGKKKKRSPKKPKPPPVPSSAAPLPKAITREHSPETQTSALDVLESLLGPT